MTGAVWYATGYLYSPYSAAEQSSALRGPAEEVVLARLVFAALPVLLQAVARCGWFISCLGLSDMPIPTPIAYFPPQSTRFWRFGGVLPSVDRGIETALSVARQAWDRHQLIAASCSGDWGCLVCHWLLI